MSFDLYSILRRGAQILRGEVMNKRRGISLIDTPEVPIIQIVPSLSFIFIVRGKSNVNHVPPRLLDPKSPLEVSRVVRRENSPAIVVLPGISIDPGFDVPLSAINGVPVIEVVTQALLGIVVQHGSFANQRRSDPFERVKLPFRKRERFGRPTRRFHDLNMEVRTGGIPGLSKFSQIISLLNPITHIEMIERSMLHMSETNIISARLIPNHDGIPPTIVIGRVGTRVVRKVVDPITDLHDPPANRRIQILPIGRIRGRIHP